MKFVQSNYEKESKEIMKKNIYPPDAPEFLRAIESAKNASDVSLVYEVQFLQ